uniref:DUF1985 domain-containing protein n=1 Tax=Solanum lycopersicum TaxID=4081 RepID=A0A3Q7I3J4_SOLLC
MCWCCRGFQVYTEQPNPLIVQNFGGNEIIRRLDLIDTFNDKVWIDNNDDVIKIAILYFIHMFVYSGKKRSLRIPRIHFDLIESDRYMHYPWGRKAFEWLLQSINKDNKNNDIAGQGSQSFTSSILSKNQNQGLIDDENTKCDESSNDGSKKVFQSIIMHIQTTSNNNSNMRKHASMESQNKISLVHIPLPTHRIRRPGPFNPFSYLTLFDSSAGKYIRYIYNFYVLSQNCIIAIMLYSMGIGGTLS